MNTRMGLRKFLMSVARQCRARKTVRQQKIDAVFAAGALLFAVRAELISFNEWIVLDTWVCGDPKLRLARFERKDQKYLRTLTLSKPRD